jgi:hypothetical protein
VDAALQRSGAKRFYLSFILENFSALTKTKQINRVRTRAAEQHFPYQQVRRQQGWLLIS